MKNLQTRKRIWVAAAAILLGAVAFFLLMPKSAGNSFLILDGRSWSGGTLRPGKTGGLQVYITVDGRLHVEDKLYQIENPDEILNLLAETVKPTNLDSVTK